MKSLFIFSVHFLSKKERWFWRVLEGCWWCLKSVWRVFEKKNRGMKSVRPTPQGPPPFTKKIHTKSLILRIMASLRGKLRKPVYLGQETSESSAWLRALPFPGDAHLRLSSSLSPPYIIIIIFSQVYKTQMGRMTEGWNGRIDEFERVNLSLQSSLARLREDNEQLRLQVLTSFSFLI